MIRKLLEAKTLDYEYEKDWSDIKREDFDKIIALDPQTDVSKNRLGSNAKQLLLPKFLEGETDFLSKPEEVRTAMETYISNRGNYPSILRNIANFPSVSDFVDYVTRGDESEFAKTHDLQDLGGSKEPKINKLDKIYNQFYSAIDREIFNKIIALDPNTTDSAIGEVAKNLLLPKYGNEKNILDDSERIEQAISLFYSERDTYPPVRRELGKYESVKEFLDFVISGGESNFVHYLNDLVAQGKLKPNSFKVLTSTRSYDVIRPLCWEANAYIVQKPSPNASSSTAKLSWCTGYNTDGHYWRNYSSYGPIICFIYKKDSTDRVNNFQLNTEQDSQKARYFLDGNDEPPWGKGAEEALKQFLLLNSDVLFAVKDVDELKKCPSVLSALEKYKLMNAPLDFNSSADIEKTRAAGLIEIVKEVNVHTKEVPATTFTEFKSLRKVNFDEGLTKIGAQAFFNCAALNNLVFPNTLQEIGAEAFAACTSLSNTIRIPDSLVKIGRRAFADTRCKLSINKDRKEKLSIDSHDHEWFVTHAKSITIQNNEALEEELNEDILDENIPRDLVKAYQNSSPAERGIQAHPDSEHKNIGKKATRRSVKFAYDQATYEQISSDQAVAYLQLGVTIEPERDANGKIIAKVRTLNRDIFNENISNLRFIIDNKVVEYEVRSGNVLYLAYWMEIPTRYFTDYPYFKGKNGPTTDVRFANKYSDIYTIIKIADKIYKTDEYEHLVGDDVVARRAAADKIRVLRKGIPTSSNRHRQHDPAYNFGAGDDYIGWDREILNYRAHAMDVPDTGAHDLTKTFNALRKFGPTEYDAYTTALQEKKNAFKTYDYLRQALKKLQNEEALYDEDEYEEALQRLTSKKDAAFETYKAKSEAVRKIKDKLTFIITQSIEESNTLIYQTLKELQQLKNKEYSAYQKLMKIKGQNIREFSGEIRRLEQQLKSYRSQLDSYIRSQQEMIQRLEQLQQQIAGRQLDIDRSMAKVAEIEQDITKVAETEMQSKFDTMQTLEDEMAKLQQDISTFIRRKRGKTTDDDSSSQTDSKPKRAFDPTLSQIISERGETFEVSDSEGNVLASFENKDSAINWADTHGDAYHVTQIASESGDKKVIWSVSGDDQ